VSLAAVDLKSCCSRAYVSEGVRYLLGDTLHPGGTALTDDLARALRVGSGDVVMDVASGLGGSATRVAATTGCSVVGVDLAAAAAVVATQRARDAGLERSARFVCADAEALPFADGSIDGALCECALCLFPDKPAAAREIARVLRPGARLALSDVSADPARLPDELRSLDAYVACLAGALPLERTAALLASAGLTVERVDRRDDVIEPMLERIGARLRLARLVVGGPLQGVVERAESLLERAWSGVRQGAIGYGVVIARR
jgi:SAM-dependent methyltransferase